MKGEGGRGGGKQKKKEWRPADRPVRGWRSRCILISTFQSFTFFLCVCVYYGLLILGEEEGAQVRSQAVWPLPSGYQSN